MRNRISRCFVFGVAVALSLSGCGAAVRYLATRRHRDDGGTDTGMTGGEQALTVPDRLARSTATPVYADDVDDTLNSPNPEDQLPALTSGLRFGSDVTLSNESHISTIADDGNDGIVVTYVIGGDETIVHFEDGDFDEMDGTYYKQVDGVEYWLWFNWADEFDYFGTIVTGFPMDDGTWERLNASGGLRTDTASLPSGTAVYYGRIRADSWLKDDPSSSPDRQRMLGDLRLTINFSDSTLDGRISRLRVRKQDVSSYSNLADTTYFVIDDGQIVNDQFTANLTGADSNVNALNDETVDGYEGGVLGEFYGPAAEEVGGVFNARRDDRVLIGLLGGTKFDPDRLAASARTAVSVGVDRDFSASTSQLTDAASVAAVESDGADGFYVTYMVDGARQRIHLPVSGYDPGDRGYDTEGPPDYGIWDAADSCDRSPEFDYVSVNGWYVWNYDTEADGTRTNHDTQRGHMVYGQPTAVLPGGTAAYDGRMYLNRWSRTDPTNSSGRRQLQSSLALTADFDNRTVGGRLHDWSQRAYAGGSYEAIDAEVAIRNGTIANAEFTADLAGTGGNFTGNMTGQFFGPGAAEVGGVIDGETTDNVFEGWFAGKKQ